jgi:hypothetical protein
MPRLLRRFSGRPWSERSVPSAVPDFVLHRMHNSPRTRNRVRLSNPVTQFSYFLGCRIKSRVRHRTGVLNPAAPPLIHSARLPQSWCIDLPKMKVGVKVCRFYLRLPTTSLFSWTSAFQLTQKSGLPDLARQLQSVEARRNRAATLW